jgi:hypothetical protein
MNDDLTAEERATRDEAIDRVESNANEEWAQTAYDIGVELASRTRFFQSKDVRDLVPDTVQTHELRALGAVMRRLHKDGVIRPTEMFKQSASLRGHARPARVWESMHPGVGAADAEGAA